MNKQKKFNPNRPLESSTSLTPETKNRINNESQNDDKQPLNPSTPIQTSEQIRRTTATDTVTSKQTNDGIEDVNTHEEPQDKLSKRQNMIQAIKFLCFSISAGAIQTLSFTLLTEVFHLTYLPSYITALALSVIWNFTLNREFTFKSANNVPLAMLKVGIYYAVFTPLSSWWGKALTAIGWNEYLVLLGTMIINLITEFLYSRLFIYRKSMNTNKRAKKD